MSTNYAIRMYDNQEYIIYQFITSLPFINTIQVCNLPNTILKGYNASLYTNSFLNLYPDNKFAKYLNEISHKESGTTVGFNLADVIYLKDWVKISPEKKIVLFDWDGTLSVIEGIILPPNKMYEGKLEDYGITYREIAEYYAGSGTRLSILKNMFLFLDSKNVDVFILTNNPIAAVDWQKLNDNIIGANSRQNFYKLAKEFIPQLKEENILCGYETNCFKPRAFLNNNYLKNAYESIEHFHFLNSLCSLH